MNNEKKVAFQKQKIEELEKQIFDLKAENETANQEIEYNKRLLALKDKELSNYKEIMENMESEYSQRMCEIKILYSKLKDSINQANELNAKFANEYKILIGRMRKQK